MIYCDIKLFNILVDMEGNFVLFDFGIVKLFEVDGVRINDEVIKMCVVLMLRFVVFE